MSKKHKKKDKQSFVAFKAKAPPKLSKPTLSTGHSKHKSDDVLKRSNGDSFRISFVHPKNVKSAFGLDGALRKPAGASFTFDDYKSNSTKKKKKKTNLSSLLKQSDNSLASTENKSKLKGGSDDHDTFEKNDMIYGDRSNYSVEEVVKDRIGCRPRSNSTDGELKLPQRGLCDEIKVLESHCWSKDIVSNSDFSMPGLNNLGNTCFMNATLQCLVYLPTFSQCAMDKGLSQTRSANGGKFAVGQKMFLQLRSLIRKLHGVGSNKPHSSMTPRAIADLIISLGSDGRKARFRLGRQEDAHEFLVHLLDAMKEGELRAAGIDSRRSGWRDRLPISRLDETTLIHRIFGGYLRSQVVCPSCGYCSNTYDPFFDLDLEVSKKRVNCILTAISEFTRKEKLDVDNRWRCSKCKKYVCPTKQLSVFRPPLTLCIQFKRFSFNSFGGGHRGKYSSGGGGKINKPIQFPSKLNLPLSDGRKCDYNLTGVVSHIGGSSSSGHYTAFVKRPSHTKSAWFHMDDSYAQEVSEKAVLSNQNAYVLFYSRSEVKVEYPKPPSGGMSSSEAVKVVAARVRARADSMASASSVDSISKNHSRDILPSLKQFHDRTQIIDSPISSSTKDVPQTARSSSTSSSSSEGSLSDVKKDLKASLQPAQLYDDNSSSDSSFTSKSLESDSSLEISEVSDEGILQVDDDGNDEISKLLGKKGPLTESLLDNNEEASFNSDDMIESSDESSEEMTELMKLAVIKKDELSDEDSEDKTVTKPDDEKPRSGVTLESVESKKETTEAYKKSKTATRLVLSDVQEGNIEVIGKRHKKLWKPIERGEKGTELLGTVKVGGWDEDEETNDLNKCDASDIKGTTNKNFEHTRGMVLHDMNKKDRERKRNHYLDRWNAKLDEGKKKKIKLNKNGVNIENTSPRANPFQRIQNSMKKMHAGWKGNQNKSKVKKHRKK